MIIATRMKPENALSDRSSLVVSRRQFVLSQAFVRSMIQRRL